jgi:RimJ/RimL family protein N-acetyltransferase
MPAAFFAVAPAIETERLILRPHRAGDLDAYAALWADPVTVRYIGGRPLTRSEAWIRILRQIGHWQVQGFGFWVVEDKATGTLAGEAGFHDVKRDIVPSLEGTLEAGWVLVPGTHGRGLGTEIVGALLAFAEAHHPGARLTCVIEPANGPSVRLAERHGFRAFARTVHGGADVTLFERQVSPGEDRPA